MLMKYGVYLILLISVSSYSQQYKDFEVGPMLNYEHTSLYAANSVFNASGNDEFSNTGFEPNFAAGIYTIYYFSTKFGLGAELYYLKTSTSRLDNDNYYNSITFMPYVNFDPFRRIKNFYFGVGAGAAFIQESPDYGTNVSEADIRVITIPLKLSTSYRIRNQVTFELGAQAELLEVVDDHVRRNAIFLGVKVPFNRVFGRYY